MTPPNNPTPDDADARFEAALDKKLVEAGDDRCMECGYHSVMKLDDLARWARAWTREHECKELVEELENAMHYLERIHYEPSDSGLAESASEIALVNIAKRLRKWKGGGK